MQPAKQKVPPTVHTGLTESNIASNPDYNPAHLIDALIERLSLKNDADLARRLQLAAAVVSKIRNKRAEITPAILVRMYDATGMDINELRALMGVKPPVFK